MQLRSFLGKFSFQTISAYYFQFIVVILFFLQIIRMPETFGTWDYVAFAVTLIISAGIGLYYRFTGGKQKTTAVSFESIYICNKREIN